MPQVDDGGTALSSSSRRLEVSPAYSGIKPHPVSPQAPSKPLPQGQGKVSVPPRMARGAVEIIVMVPHYPTTVRAVEFTLYKDGPYPCYFPVYQDRVLHTPQSRA